MSGILKMTAKRRVHSGRPRGSTYVAQPEVEEYQDRSSDGSRRKLLEGDGDALVTLERSEAQLYDSPRQARASSQVVDNSSITTKNKKPGIFDLAMESTRRGIRYLDMVEKKLRGGEYGEARRAEVRTALEEAESLYAMALERLRQALEPSANPRYTEGKEDSAVAIRFRELSQQWYDTRPPSSFIEQLAMHPAYQRIIGLGPTVVPLILRELTVKPDHWFWALYAITGEDPVRESDCGDLQRMADAWLEWGHEQGLI